MSSKKCAGVIYSKPKVDESLWLDGKNPAPPIWIVDVNRPAPSKKKVKGE